MPNLWRNRPYDGKKQFLPDSFGPLTDIFSSPCYRCPPHCYTRAFSAQRRSGYALPTSAITRRRALTGTSDFMKLLLNIESLVPPLTGIGNYTFNLIEQLQNYDIENIDCFIGATFCSAEQALANCVAACNKYVRKDEQTTSLQFREVLRRCDVIAEKPFFVRRQHKNKRPQKSRGVCLDLHQSVFTKPDLAGFFCRLSARVISPARRSMASAYPGRSTQADADCLHVNGGYPLNAPPDR